MRKLLLTLALALTFAGGASAQAYDRVELWHKEIDLIAEVDRRQTPPRDPVLFVGSSSIRKWDGLRQDFPRRAVVNRGFGGSHIEDVNYYFDRLVTPFQPKMIFLYAGENDVTAGKTPERVHADFVKFVSLARQKSPKSKIFFISLKPSPARWELREKFAETNRLIRTECEKGRNLTFVDVWPAMLGADGTPKAEIFISDRLHMNQKGYDLWRETLKKYLK
jgi:lysophospholipase L1-like esterase